MKLITDINDLKGKTIKNTALIDCGDALGFLFKDKSYCVVGIHLYCGGDTELKLNKKQDFISDQDLFDLGVISQAEYKEKRAAIEKENEQRHEGWERLEYERLKAKFEG